jgi:hypothetical protein
MSGPAPNMQSMMYTYYGAPVHLYRQQQQHFYQQQYAHPGHYYQQQHYHPNDEILFQKVKAQIEYYFRPQNLQNDSFLQAQLNATEHLGAVPIHILCSFPKVREIYTLSRYGPNFPRHQMPLVDPNILRIALRGSDIVVVSEDGMWISPVRSPPKAHPVTAEVDQRPLEVVDCSEGMSGQDAASSVGQDKDECATAKDSEATSTTANSGISSVQSAPSSPLSQSSSLGVPTHPLPSLKERTTVILRDIPDTATEIEVMEAFSSETVKPKSATPDVGNTWYISFESEEQAVTALSSTWEKTIAGAPIRGRLKGGSRNSISMPPLPPTASLHPAQVVARTDHASISSATNPSSVNSTTNTLAGSSYPPRSGRALSSPLTQSYGYVTSGVAYGFPVARNNHPQYPGAYQMQQQQLFHQKYHHHSHEQQHFQQKHQQVLHSRRPSGTHSPQADSGAPPVTSNTISQGFSQHQQHPQKQRHSQPQTASWRVENQPDGPVQGSGTAHPTEQDSLPSTQNLSHQTEEKPKNYKKSRNNKIKQSMKTKTNNPSNLPDHNDSELDKKSAVSTNTVSANTFNRRSSKVDYHPQSTTSNNIDKNGEERTTLVKGDNSFPIGKKQPGGHPNRPKIQENSGSHNYDGSNTTQNFKGKKYISKKKEGGTIPTVELNAADFPALSVPTTKAAGQSTLNPSPAKLPDQIQRFGYAQAVLRMPSPAAKGASKGSQACIESEHDLAARMDTSLAFTETGAPEAFDEW